LAALIKSARPELTNKNIRDLILGTATNLDQLNPDYAGKLGNGLINPVGVFNNLDKNFSDYKLIKSSQDTVYYYGVDGNRYVFPDEKTYKSWYNDFSQITLLSDQELAQIPLAGLITYRPGKTMVKITSSPDVYAVSKNGILRKIDNEDLAAYIYGPSWAQLVNDLDPAFFINYQIGEPVDDIFYYYPSLELSQATSIDVNKKLFN